MNSPPPTPVFQPGSYHSDRRNGQRILVVDDDDSKRYSIVRTLSAAGYTVDEAATGKEGLARVPGHHAVVLDVQLPDMSGFDVCREMKRLVPGIPVVQVSAVFTQESSRAAGKLCGAAMYLADPGVQELIEAVDLVLEKR